MPLLTILPPRERDRPHRARLNTEMYEPQDISAAAAARARPPGRPHARAAAHKLLGSDQLKHRVVASGQPTPREWISYRRPAMRDFRKSENSTQNSPRRFSFATGPSSVNSRYFLPFVSNLGHTGRPSPFGSPVWRSWSSTSACRRRSSSPTPPAARVENCRTRSEARRSAARHAFPPGRHVRTRTGRPCCPRRRASRRSPRTDSGCACRSRTEHRHPHRADTQEPARRVPPPSAPSLRRRTRSPSSVSPRRRRANAPAHCCRLGAAPVLTAGGEHQRAHVGHHVPIGIRADAPAAVLAGRSSARPLVAALSAGREPPAPRLDGASRPPRLPAAPASASRGVEPGLPDHGSALRNGSSQTALC